MTFDEAYEELKNDVKYKKINADVVNYIFDKLREEYAPTVEMTEVQRDLILRNRDEDKLYEIMGDEDGYYFDSLYWGVLEPHEVAQAYLHPETIKVVDE
ncbi:hypothetical protein [Leuconostoc lactis]|uniref:hypothetical protein n=1 Tax=Leuconostoc lactis TaxID=1246 RepID=UPI0010227700|nr:hypothetical protein [Leuconostoc lactis]MSB66627.1 hypothetical protein [Leuconostoc lactis]RYS88535.1 hypothetical protein EAI73_03725 [Leuconostoc lactis]